MGEYFKWKNFALQKRRSEFKSWLSCQNKNGKAMGKKIDEFLNVLEYMPDEAKFIIVGSIIIFGGLGFLMCWPFLGSGSSMGG